MDTYAVMAEVAATVDTITGLRAYAWKQGTVAAPAALIGWPDRIEYAQTYRRGMTRIPDLPMLVLCGEASQRVAAKRIGEFVAESGAKSIPAVIEGREGSWVACDSVTVSWVGFPAVKVAGIDYLAAEFHLDVIGKGA